MEREDLEQKVQQEAKVSEQSRKSYTQILIACGGIFAVLIVGMVLWRSLAGFQESTGTAMRDAVGLAGEQYLPGVACQQTDACDACLNLPPGKMCSCDEECESGVCLEEFCRAR